MKKDNRPKLDRGNALAVSAILLCFMLTIGLAGLFSGGGFLAALSWNDDGFTYWAVSNGTYDNILLAREDAAEVKQKGGAGYVLSKDGVYHLVLNVYCDKNSAETVLSKQGAGAYLVEIYVPAYDFSWCKTGERNKIEAAFKSFNEIFQTLYETANSLDGGNIAEADAKEALITAAGKIEYIKSDLTDVANCDELTKLNSGLSSAAAVVNAVANGGSADMLSSMRYASVSVLIIAMGI